MLYPELWGKLRIHKSPSGGYHILYRVSNGLVPGNLKLASRPALEAELQLKPKEKTKCFLETRGEGGYILSPPSMGYSIHKDKPLPVITWEERCSLIRLCESYNQIIKIEPTYKPTKSEDTWYDENPFEHYNNSCDPISLMDKNGWSFYKENNFFFWFTRPGKNKGISASFNKQKRVFYIFTASTELDENKGYHPSTLLSHFSFAGDKKKTYTWLVQNGYGKVKPKIEAEQVKKKALAGKQLPKNFSEEAKEQYIRTTTKLEETNPFGIFWREDEDGKIVMDREALYVVADNLGFKLFGNELIQIQKHLIHRREERDFFDSVKSYIKEEDAEFYREICNAYEAFIQRNGSFTITRLRIIDETLILKDTATTSFKFFNNCYVRIQSESIELLEYANIEGLIWAENIQPRDYIQSSPGGLYFDFICKATPFAKSPNYIKKIIGYLSHQFKDETTGYIVVLTEECPDPKNGGGTGKNIFSQLFQYTTTFINIPGTQVKYDEKFLQAWNYQKIMAISDVPKKFDFSFLKELSTGVGILKKLFKDELSVPVEFLPKFLIQTNYSYEISDGGLKRRIIPVEFTNFFTISGGVDVHYGCHFPKGWSNEDWAGYDAFIFECIQCWIKGGRKLNANNLTEGGWLKQFDQSYGLLTREFIEENFDCWKRMVFISNETFMNDYTKFCTENNIGYPFRLSSQKMNRAIEDWCRNKNTVLDHNARKKENGILLRGREFLELAPF